jgi:hypothetical protein
VAHERTVYVFEPVGADRWDARAGLKPGDRVVKTQPRGCPRNGTLGHCFVADPVTGVLLGLVLVASLRRDDAAEGRHSR